MKEKYNALFDKLAPQRSDEELLRAVLDRKAENMSNSKEKKRLGRKAVIIPAVAAAVLLCTTVGVSAAKSWTVFDSVFNQKPDTPNANGFVFDDFDFNEFGGKELNETIDFDGYSVELKSVVADKYSTMVFYDIVFDEEAKVFTATFDDSRTVSYSYADYAEGDRVVLHIERNGNNVEKAWDDYIRAHLSPDGTYNGAMIDYQNNSVLLNKEGNVFHCMFRYDSIGVPIEGTEVVFDIHELILPAFAEPAYDYEDPYNLKHFSINFDFIKENDDLIVEGNTPFTLDSGESGALTYAHLTSLTLALRVEWEGVFDEASKVWREYGGLDDENNVLREIKVRFKDGTEISDGAIGMNPYFGNARLIKNGALSEQIIITWEYPIKVENIDAIIIGDGEFKIN